MQPVSPIEVQAPVPSILTTARDRSGDEFGERADAPPSLGEGVPAPFTHSWRTGITWTPLSCSPSSSWPQCPSQADVDAGKDQPAEGAHGLVASSPFWVYTPFECEWGTVQRGELERLTDQLTQAHSAERLGAALWMGEGLPDADGLGRPQPTLRRSATDVSAGGGAVYLDEAVGLLLSAYEAATGGLGGAVLHVPSILIPHALSGTPGGGGAIARPEGATLYRGPLGSLVSPGPGYPSGASAEGADGHGPLTDDDPTEVYAGNADDEVWVYVSGPVEWAGSSTRAHHEAAGDELRTNVAQVLSERQMIFRFDPCAVFAAKAIWDPSIVGGSS